MRRAGLLVKGSARDQTWLDKITIDQRGEETVLSCARIILVEAKGEYLSFVTADKAYRKPGKITRLGKDLDPGTFLRIHRSTLVNKKKIARVSPLPDGRMKFHMSNDRVVTSSATYQDAIHKALPHIA